MCSVSQATQAKGLTPPHWLPRYDFAEAEKQRALRLMDEENRLEALRSAETESHAALREMVRLRTQFVLSGFDLSILCGGSPELRRLIAVVDGATKGEEGVALADEVLEELGQEMGASAALLQRAGRVPVALPDLRSAFFFLPTLKLHVGLLSSTRLHAIRLFWFVVSHPQSRFDSGCCGRCWCRADLEPRGRSP